MMLTKKYLLVICGCLLTSTTVFAQSTIDYTDLDHAICIHGTFANPAKDTGRIDYGPASIESCHTIHTDITDYNEHTNFLLRCTTPDGRPAVRLGNMKTGGDASRIAYTYTVDANNTILVLDYAAILEDPNHSKAEQPKFVLELFDGDGNPLVDEYGCSSFNFIAGNTTDGWNTVDGKDYVWKDWTTMGVNLRPYIGQQIKIQLTVFDCKPAGHFGYAYYALSVRSDQMKSTICGALEETVTFTAPEGFDYVWYVEGTDPAEPENVLSIDPYFIHDTRTMPQRTYLCDVLNTENPDCKFTLSATPKNRFPLALFDVDRHTGTCSDTLYLTNRSGVSADNIHLNDPYEPCDNIHWDFGDGRTIDGETPEYIVFDKPGTYDVQLTVGLDAWTCSSEKTDQSHKVFTVTVGEITSETYDTICYGDTLSWHDMKLYRSGTYVDTIPSQRGCDSICTLHLSYHPAFNHVNKAMYEDALRCGYDLNKIWPGIYDPSTSNSWADPYILPRQDTIEHDTICGVESFYWPKSGKTYYESGLYIENPGTIHGCDSLIILDLKLNVAYFELKQDTIQLGETYTWKDSKGNQRKDKLTGLTDFKLPGEYRDTIPNESGNHCDSVFVLQLEVELTPDTTRDKDSICDGDFYTWAKHGEKFAHLTIDSTYHDTLRSVLLGKDSILYELTLTVQKPTDKPQETATICSGETYTWKGHIGFETLTQDTFYYDTLRYAGTLCDSLRYVLKLTVLDTTVGDTTAIICRNKLPLTWYEHTLSPLQADTIVKHRFVGGNQFGCDSILTLTLTILDTVATNDGATVCSNELPYTWKDETREVYTFTEQDWKDGKLVKTHTFEGVNTCDSVVTFTLTVKDTVATNDGATICSNELPYTWKDGTTEVYTFTEQDRKDGKLVKTHTFEGVNACDSVVTFTLTVKDTFALTTGKTICPAALPYDWKNGETVVYTFTEDDWKEGNLTQTATLSAANTCDSVVTFTLTVKDIMEETDDATVCSNRLPYTWKNGTEDVYTFTVDDWKAGNLKKEHTFIAKSTSCDSVVTFTLTVKDTVATNDGATICSNELPYTWKDGTAEVYTFTEQDWKAGKLVKTHTFQGVNTCDSVVTFTLTVYEAYNNLTDGATVCSNELPYTWKNGATPIHTFTEAGAYTATLKTVHDCDSVVTFTLTVHEAYHDLTDGTTVCSNQLPYTWKNGTTPIHTFTEAGAHTETLKTMHGCDSVVTFTLVVNKESSSETSLTKCNDELPYLWNGISCTQTKDYTYRTTNAAGCDSVATLHFTVEQCVCYGLEATITIDTLCANQKAWLGTLSVTQGVPLSYDVHYPQSDPNGHFTDVKNQPLTADAEQRLTIPFAEVSDTTRYIKPNDYPVQVLVTDTCGNVHTFNVEMHVLYPSWIIVQRWNDVLALYNERYNGGYQFSRIRWYKMGRELPGRGDHNSYIYEGNDSNTSTLDYGHPYWAGLVREGESKEICTCPIIPQPTTNTGTRFANKPIQVASRNHGHLLHLTTDLSGTYVIYDVCGKQLQSGYFGDTYHAMEIQVEHITNAGTYVIHFRADDGTSDTQKLMIE